MRERRWWDSTWARMVFCGLVALVTLQVLDGKLDAGGFVEGLVGISCALLLYGTFVLIRERLRS